MIQEVKNLKRRLILIILVVMILLCIINKQLISKIMIKIFARQILSCEIESSFWMVKSCKREYRSTLVH